MILGEQCLEGRLLARWRRELGFLRIEGVCSGRIESG